MLKSGRRRLTLDKRMCGEAAGGHGMADMFDFDKKVDRRGTDSYKWNVAEHELPMWVADMDFETAPCIREAIENRASHGLF